MTELRPIIVDDPSPATAQAELEQSERLFRGVFEGALDAMLISDDDGAFVDANPAACRLLDAPRHRLMRLGFSDFVPAASARAAEAAWREFRMTGEQSGEIQLVTATGRVVDAEYARRADVLPGRHLSVLRDVTPRHEIERQRRGLLASLVNAQEEERQRIASDIHDDSVQVLTALLLRLGMLKRAIEDPGTAEQVSEIEGSVQLSIARLRHLIFQLRPPALDRAGLAAALRLLLEQTRAEYGVEFALSGRLDPEPDPHVRAVAYRIAQEAITNVAKHAAARRIEVTLATEDGGELAVTIRDDGRGFDPAIATQPGHVGLTSMRERAEINGGRLRIASAPGDGALVELFLPVPRNDETIGGGARATASRADS